MNFPSQKGQIVKASGDTIDFNGNTSPIPIIVPSSQYSPSDPAELSSWICHILSSASTSKTTASTSTSTSSAQSTVVTAYSYAQAALRNISTKVSTKVSTEQVPPWHWFSAPEISHNTSAQGYLSQC